MLEGHKCRLQRSLNVRLNEVRAHNNDDNVVETLDVADASASNLEQAFGIAYVELASQSLRQVEQAWHVSNAATMASAWTAANRSPGGQCTSGAWPNDVQDRAHDGSHLARLHAGQH
jgi:hypothetical protein